MENQKQQAIAYIDAHADLFTSVSDDVWGYAELSLAEVQSCERYRKALTEAGFTVQVGLHGVDTAVTGTFGSGHPVIGILAEYDALSGLSQAGGATHKTPEPGMTDGHGCGHNLLGAGSLAAACAVKAYLEATGKPGTVIFYGCPGEEGGAAKTIFAKQNEFCKLDAAFSWHPDDVNEVQTGRYMACIQTEYQFTGVSSHAAGAPEQGRSALDAVALMNVGVQFLREHMPRSASIHYAVTDAGGVSPNVVQANAKVLYMVRDESVHSALKLQKRVDDIALGASLMTGTTFEKHFIDGTSDTMPNKVLGELMYQNLVNTPLPTYTEAERRFADELAATYADRVEGLPGTGARQDEGIAAVVSEQTQGGKRVLNDLVMPLYYSLAPVPGSTDVGDVSWQTPTAQISAVTHPSLCPGHSWQNVSCGKTSIAHKGMLYAARVMAGAAIDVLADPSVLVPARAEFTKNTAKGYVSPIPD